MNANTDSTPAHTRSPVRVLVAEDSPLNLQVAMMQLQKLGYEADAAVDGTEVMEAVKQTHYDIILMDCQMPELSGYEASWQIREKEKEAGESTRRAYIIAMTANTKADHESKCRSAGMDDFIIKPVQLPELEAALHRALADRATQQAIEEVIDPVVIAGLRQLSTPGNPNPLARLTDLFLREAPKGLSDLEAAIKANDLNSLSRIISAATALKGSAGNLGARNLAALCDEIEQTSKSGLLADALPILQKANEEFARVREALGKIASESSPATASRS